MRQNIILVDDHPLVLKGIKNWIETHSHFEVPLIARTFEECSALEERFGSNFNGREYNRIDNPAQGLNPSDFVAIVDISFKPSVPPGLPSVHEENQGFEIIRSFTAFGIPCIAFSSHDSGGYVERAMSAEIGAKGFVSKTADETILLAAITSVSNGGTYIQAELVTDFIEVRDIAQTFTAKEKSVADAITLYNTNAQVAAALNISEKTVVNYLTILYDKAGVQNKTQFLEKMGRI